MTSIVDDVASSSPWEFILVDILGAVLRFLPCLADRAAVRSVCRHWRAAAQERHSLPPPLPLLVLPRFRFFSFSTQGAVVAMRRGWMPEEVASGHVCCVACEGWLLVARRCEDATGSERFLVNAFTHEVVPLPRLRAPYCTTTSGNNLPWTANDDPSLDHVVLSAPPGSATKCMVAGFSYGGPVPGGVVLVDWSRLPRITLWQPGMKSWYVCHSHSVYWLSDLVFHQGKLYELARCWYTTFEQSPRLFAFTLGEDEHGVNISSLEHRVTLPPIPVPGPDEYWFARCNMVQWRGRLVLIIRYVHGCHTAKVDVLALDLSIDPCGVTSIRSFNGDCVFVDQCRCTSFPAAGSYEGVQGDCIYFVDKYKKNAGPSYVTAVYNMRDCTMKPFTAELLSDDPAEDNLTDPVWMFPPA